MEQELKRRIEELEKKVNDLYNPASFPQLVIDGLVKRGFLRTDSSRIIRSIGTSGVEFYGVFVKTQDGDVFLNYEPKINFLKIESINLATDTITITNHGLSDGDFVGLATTIDAPGGLNPPTSYYVRDAATNTLKLTNTPGGTAFNITSQGLGSHYIVIQ